ncbi:hypothetical protein GQ55_1G199000 [Panicum hallii var. hallii]|uniref:Uncharacterized protein n=2 Tax=Panicum hallii TaxID=206008 RepID=A0A2T7F6C1_9POAL|nr:hypothetical protein GQ55_1G199000 [Panicum hallii var. hallii]PVH66341.1 hypothetical protein PAHAL_1G214400 [Panicum hallii]
MWKDVCTFYPGLLCKLLLLPSLGSEGLIGTRSACPDTTTMAPPSSSHAISTHTPMDTDSENN